MNDEDHNPSVSKTPIQTRAGADVRYQYLLEEMKAARFRIDEEIRTMNQFEILTIIAIGLIYWLILSAENISHLSLSFASFFPVLITAYGIFRYRAHAHVVKVHEAYVKMHVERTVFGKMSLKGLVKYYDRKKNGTLKTARFAFWVATFCISLSLFVICLVAPEKVRQMEGDLRQDHKLLRVEILL